MRAWARITLVDFSAAGVGAMASSQAQAEITERRLRPLYGEGRAERPDHATELCTRLQVYTYIITT